MTLVSEARFLVGTRILLLRKFLKACFFIFVDLQCWLLSCFARRVVLEELKFLRIIRIGTACAPVWVRWRRTSTHPHTHQDNTGGMVRFGAMIRPSSCTYGTSHLLADSWPHCATWPSLSSSLWLSRHEPRATERTNRFLAWTCVDVSVGAAALYRCMSGCRRTPLGHGTEILWGFSLQSSNSLCFNPFQSVRRSRRATYTT